MAPIGEVKRSPATICEFEWILPDFLTLSQKTDECHFSPKFWFAGKSCSLSIAPNGYERQNSLGNIGLYLMRNRSYPSVRLEVFFSMKTSDWEEDQQRHYAKYDIQHNLEVYGIPRFLPRSELMRRKSELLPSNVLTVRCTVKCLKSTENAGNLGTAECSFCEKPFDPESVSSHEKKCAERPIRCPDCSDELLLQDWHDHECQPPRAEGGIGTAGCSYCEKTLFLENIPSHEKKCMERLITCPVCSGAVLLVDWRYHMCQTAAANAGNIETAKCSYCQKILKAESISLHERKCVKKSMKCPECSAVILLQDWYDHECQAAEVLGATGTSESSVASFENKVLHDFKDLFISKEDCDVVIKLKGQEFPAHRNILKGRSPVLASTFRNDMKERATGVVEIDDCDLSCFSDFLCFLYCGDEGLISQENVYNLFIVADKYDVQDLRSKCVKFMMENLSVDTFCDTITLALRHSETELVKLTTDFFIKNAPKIIVTVKWQLFLNENPTHSNELLIKLLVNNPSTSK